MIHCYRCNAPLLPHESAKLHRFAGLLTYLCESCQAIEFRNKARNIAVFLTAFLVTQLIMAIAFLIGFIF